MRLQGVVMSASCLCLAACSSSLSTTAIRTEPSAKPGSPGSPIQHVVILVQENRSFNNLFLGFPGAATRSRGRCKEFDPPGGGKPVCPGGEKVTLQQISLGKGPKGGGADIEHDHRAFKVEFDGGKMDGFGSIYKGTVGRGGTPAGTYPYSYVKRSAVQPYWDMATQYTLADHMFTTETTDSFVAHQELIAGTVELNPYVSLTNVPSNRPWGCDNVVKTTSTDLLHRDGRVTRDGPFPCLTQYKTMADVLDAAGVSWRYYVQSLQSEQWSGSVWNAFDAIKSVRYGPDWKNVTSPQTRIFKDVSAGKLPAVSWVIPDVYASDHPASGENKGPSWVTAVVNAIGESPYWQSTAVVVIWDDWGGWYDPVPPPQLDYTSLGLRVPMIVISPYAKPHHVSKTQYEFGSILKFIEENFGTQSLGATDVRANSIRDVFNFSQKPIMFRPFTAQYPKAYFIHDHRDPPLNVREYDGSLPG